VDSRLGKNAAYAFLALHLLSSRSVAPDVSEIWDAVKDNYRRRLATEPGKNEKAAVRVALGLLGRNTLFRKLSPVPTFASQVTDL